MKIVAGNVTKFNTYSTFLGFPSCLVRVFFVSCSGISLNGLLRAVEKCKYETKETR